MKKQKKITLTKESYVLLVTLAENEIKQWTKFINILNEEYGTKITKGRKAN